MFLVAMEKLYKLKKLLKIVFNRRIRDYVPGNDRTLKILGSKLRSLQLEVVPSFKEKGFMIRCDKMINDGLSLGQKVTSQAIL